MIIPSDFSSISPSGPTSRCGTFPTRIPSGYATVLSVWVELLNVDCSRSNALRVESE
eukprot:COSAG02_NODE_800_length_17049_cov_14.510737_8_plen_57_part_00